MERRSRISPPDEDTMVECKYHPLLYEFSRPGDFISDYEKEIRNYTSEVFFYRLTLLKSVVTRIFTEIESTPTTFYHPHVRTYVRTNAHTHTYLLPQLPSSRVLYIRVLIVVKVRGHLHI